MLIQFFNYFLALSLGTISFRLPKTISTIESWLGYDTSTKSIRKYVMCTVCHSLYADEPLSLIPNKCSKMKSRRAKCNNPLFRPATTPNIRGRPFKAFAYCSVIESLKEMLMRKGFEEQIEQWRTRDYSNFKARFDCYDGALWKELLDDSGESFTNNPRSLMATINIDWFSPFDSNTTKHNSVDGIYMTLDSLPRNLRYLPGNIIFLGCMPGPSEPKTTEINNYFKIIIDELLPLYHGLDMKTYNSKGESVKVRLALLKLAADSPSPRKCTGFLSYNNFHCCLQCDHLFKHTDGTPGLDLSKWGPFPKRELTKVNEYAKKWASCTTAKERKSVEDEGGVRDSELYRLPYWNPLRQATYDPFRMLLLGVCKKMIEVWLDKMYLNKPQTDKMQKRVDSIILPPGFADLGNNIESGFSYMSGARLLT